MQCYNTPSLCWFDLHYLLPVSVQVLEDAGISGSIFYDRDLKLIESLKAVGEEVNT